jgi:hypothetical protein
VTTGGFRDAELARFEASGWRRIEPLAAGRVAPAVPLAVPTEVAGCMSKLYN